MSDPIPQGVVIWLTGVPAAGKSTLAGLLVRALRRRGLATVWLDSDDVRRVLTPEPTYTPAERDRFYAALAHLAGLAAEGGAQVVVSATAPLRAHRRSARERVDHFFEVWVRCAPDTARRRDPKGLYERSERGEIDALPGADVDYQPPGEPDLVLETDRTGPDESARRLEAALGERFAWL